MKENEKCKQCEFWVIDNCYLSSDCPDCFKYSMFRKRQKENDLEKLIKKWEKILIHIDKRWRDGQFKDDTAKAEVYRLGICIDDLKKAIKKPMKLITFIEK